jgi:RES domain-containing protein
MSAAFYKSPFGSSSNAGRWNPRGSRMIYAGSAPSVALLEYLCIKGNTVALGHWHMVEFEIADEALIGTLDSKNLPKDWDALPHGKSTQDFGKAWLDEREFPFLRVPSARIDLLYYPQESNVLINPDFPGLTEALKVLGERPFDYLLNF